MEPKTTEVRLDPSNILRIHTDAEGRAIGGLYTWRDAEMGFGLASYLSEPKLRELVALMYARADALEAAEGDE